MASNKAARQGSFLSSFPLLTAANLLFFCFEFILLTNIACLVMPKHGMFAHLAGSLSDIRNHAIMNTVIVLAAFLTWASGTMWPDVLGALGILYVNASAAEHIWLSARESPTIDA